MSGFFNQFLRQLAEGDQIRDYQHAARTFVDSLYRLSPKSGALFHVFIELNPAVAKRDPQNANSNYELGLMAKTAQLPKFTIQNKVLNSYNRKNIVQERINYDPISITFHDDSANVVRNFWNGYYSYYYRDADHSQSLYNQEYKYDIRQEQNWGFSPKNTGAGAPNYINAIRIYSLHQKSFSSYILFRPTIQAFQHGDHTQGEYTPLEHSMTVAYEAVQYEYGPVSRGTVMGFNIMHYDNTPSPLSSLGGGTTSILGPGGLVEGVADSVTNLQNGNYGASLLGSLRTFNNFKNTNLKTVAGAELAQTATNILRGQNTQSTIFVPTASSVQDGISKAVQSIPGLAGNTPYGKPAGGVQNMNTQSNQVPPLNAGTIFL
jgi:hypothetical protein